MRHLFFILILLQSSVLFASEHTLNQIDLTQNFWGYFCLAIFVLAYVAVILEEKTHMRKSKPVILAAGIIWIVIALIYAHSGDSTTVAIAAKHNLLEYAELMLFLMVAMTYVNAMEERNVFNCLKYWLTRKGFSLRQIFWMTGLAAFSISPVADNLTTALIMCAVVLSVGGNNKKFIAASCTSIVIAANAGGAFSPFGDITTLMVWQKGLLRFDEFLCLFFPAIISWLIPAMLMVFTIKKGSQSLVDQQVVVLKRGAKGVVFFFFLTVLTAVLFHNFLHLPPVLGMFTGFSFLQMYGYYLKKTYSPVYMANKYDIEVEEVMRNQSMGSMVPFDVFAKIARSEWDTLLFFYGVVMCVGGLSLIGYLAIFSELMYTSLGPTMANCLVGVFSSVIDNIPVMFAVLTMNPEMSDGQWLLVTLTAGIGGSLLSIGSAAGVALMGQSKGNYTFMSHIKWTPIIALGYVVSILVHLWLNQHLM